MNTSTSMRSQLLATKFYVPVASRSLISRPRLTALLDESVKRPLTLISAPAGFGKTTLLSAWTQSLSAHKPLVAWVSLDEEDNEPRLFWSYVLSALDRQQPQQFTPLLIQVQSAQSPSLKSLLTALINLLTESTEHFVLILDDYQMISEEEVHTTLSYLIEHLPPQLRILLSTRADPPLPLPLHRARHQMHEVRTKQLRCTAEETGAFFKEVMGIQLPNETIQQVTTRTEGWLVGLQLLGLSLPEHADPTSLLEQVSGDQRYILDYLTEEVLRRQPQEVQTFLLSTSILERLTASLCDAVMQQTGSQQMLQRLELANLFVVSLDSKRQWYRYHALFAEALRCQLEQKHADQIPTLHYYASLWYAQHDQITQAILHACHAKEWHWVTHLIEHISLFSLTWGAGEHEWVILWQWLEQLPTDIVHFHPRLCLACAQMLWAVAPQSTLVTWLDVAETRLTISLSMQVDKDASQVRQEQQDLLGELITVRAFLQTFFDDDGSAFLALCQQALALLSADNYVARAFVAFVQLNGYYYSSANNAMAAIRCGMQGDSLAQVAGKTAWAIITKAVTATYMIGAGQLHDAQRLTQEAILLGRQPGNFELPTVGRALLVQAEILRERNDLDAALPLAEEALKLSEQTKSITTTTDVFLAYAVLLRIHLSCGKLEAAQAVLQQLEHRGMVLNQPVYLLLHSFFATIDQIRLWLAREELDHATRWTEELNVRAWQGTPFIQEREEVALVRILLAKKQPDVALKRLEHVLERAITGQRWGHVIEQRILQALACQMCGEEMQALGALSEAIHLAEPEGYIRSFVDEGASMEVLLYQLRRQDRKHGPTPYLDRLLATFQQKSIADMQAEKFTKIQRPLNSLSERELQVLHLLAQGASNQEIAQELVIAIDTVKRHVSHIFSKLGVSNRVQAVNQARALGWTNGNPDT